MSSLKIPQSTIGLTSLLRAALTAVEQDRQSGDHWLSEAWQTQARHILPDLIAKTEAVQRLAAARALRVAEQNALVEPLKVYVRDFLVVARRRALRLGWGRDYFAGFGLTSGGKLPNPAGMEQAFLWADLLLREEAIAVAHGFAPMVNPSAAEVQALYEQAAAAQTAVSLADQHLQQAQHTLDEARQRAYACAKECAAEMRFALRHHDPDDGRRIMRRYGWHYFTPKAKAE